MRVALAANLSIAAVSWTILVIPEFLKVKSQAGANAAAS